MITRAISYNQASKATGQLTISNCESERKINVRVDDLFYLRIPSLDFERKKMEKFISKMSAMEFECRLIGVD